MPENDDVLLTGTLGPFARVSSERWVFVGDEIRSFVEDWLKPFLGTYTSKRIEGYVLDLGNGSLLAALEAANMPRGAGDDIVLRVSEADDARAARALTKLMRNCDPTTANNRLTLHFDTQRWPKLLQACTSLQRLRQFEVPEEEEPFALPESHQLQIDEGVFGQDQEEMVVLGDVASDLLGEGWSTAGRSAAAPAPIIPSGTGSFEDYPYYPIHILVDGDKSGERYTMRILPGAPVTHDAAETWTCPAALSSKSQTLMEHLDLAIHQATLDDAELPDIQDFGDTIDAALLSVPELKSCLEANLKINVATADAGLLIRFHFGKYAHHLSDIAWETWRHDLGGGRPFLIEEEWISLVRFVPSEGPMRHRKKGDQSLKLVLVESSFNRELREDKAIITYFEDERKSIESAVGGLMVVVPLVNPTFDELKAELKDADICHFFGHGFVDDKERGFIVLKDHFDGRRGRRIPWDLLRVIFYVKNAPYLQLVNLSACSLQKAGFGTNLAKIGIPAVIAMQGPITALSVAKGVFSQELYRRFAAGWPLHRAFSEARRAIKSRSSRIESFMPVLIMSTYRDISLKHPNLQKAKELVKQSELEHDPLKSIWTEAEGLERRGDLEAALPKLEIIMGSKPNYPGVKEKISDLRSRIDRQKRVETLSAQIRVALTAKDYGAFKSIMAEVKPLVGKEALLSATLEMAFFTLSRELGELRTEKRWLPAKQVVQVLYSMSQLIPSHPEVPYREEIENEADRDEALQLRKLRELEGQRRFDELAELAQRLLAVQPENQQFRSLFDKAQLARQIQVASMTDLRQEAERHRRERQWSDLKKVTREMRRLNPSDEQVTTLLQEALRGEAEGFRRGRRWDEAEANYIELLDLLPEGDRPTVSELLATVRLEHALHAKRNRQWEVVATATRQVLGDRTVSKARKQEAQRLREEADNALQLLNRIKLL